MYHLFFYSTEKPDGGMRDYYRGFATIEKAKAAFDILLYKYDLSADIIEVKEMQMEEYKFIPVWQFRNSEWREL